MTETTSAAVAAAPKKARLVDRYFIDADGERSARASGNVVKVIHEWKDRPDLKLEMDISSLSDEMKIAAIAFGISQVVGNAYGGETDPDDAYEKGESRWETIGGGNWATERVVGDRTSDLVAAFEKAYQDAGKPFTDADRASIQEKLDSGVLDPKEVRANPRIRAALDAIKLARAQARFEKSKAAASDASDLPVI